VEFGCRLDDSLRRRLEARGSSFDLLEGTKVMKGLDGLGFLLPRHVLADSVFLKFGFESIRGGKITDKRDHDEAGAKGLVVALMIKAPFSDR
jgi:hypothetical protein